MQPSEYLPEDKRPCIICKSSKKYQSLFKDLERKNSLYNLLICPQCRLGKTDPFPEERKMKELYSSIMYRDHESRFIPLGEKGIWLFRRFRRKRIERIVRKGRILDIGCGRGLFLSIMKESGWETFGLELNEETAWYARNALGLNIKTDSLVDAHFDDRFFDVITLWHVLEHLPDPVLTIEECRRILKPGGLLVIAIPNFDSLQARISGRYWFHLDIPYHLYHFNNKNLDLFLRKFSFKIIKCKQFSFEFNPFGYLQSFLNMSHIEYNLLYNLLKSQSLRDALSRNLQKNRFYLHLCMTGLLIPFFAPFSLVFSILEALLRKGGTIEVYALKEDS